MRAAVAVTFILLLLLACKKDKGEGPVNLPVINGLTDFALVPVSDAEWNIHIQGIVGSNGKVDTSHHVYVNIRAAGKDTAIYTRHYHEYDVTVNTVSSNFPAAPQNYTAYIREDTPAKVIYRLLGTFDEEYVVSLKDEEVGRIVNAQPQIEIKYVDSLIMEKQYLERWIACNSYDRSLEYFYKAYGIGGPAGILPRSSVVPAGGQVVEISFRYKNSKQKFINSVIF